MTGALTQVESLSVLHSFLGQVADGPAVESYAEYEELVHGNGLPLALAAVIENHEAAVRPRSKYRLARDVHLSLGDDADQLSATVSHKLDTVDLTWRYRQGLFRRKMRDVVMLSVDRPDRDWAMTKGRGVFEVFEPNGRRHYKGAIDTLNGFLQVTGRAVERLVAGVEAQ